MVEARGARLLAQPADAPVALEDVPLPPLEGPAQAAGRGGAPRRVPSSGTRRAILHRTGDARGPAPRAEADQSRAHAYSGRAGPGVRRARLGWCDVGVGDSPGPPAGL